MNLLSMTVYGVVLLLQVMSAYISGAERQIPVQVVPDGIESVNGSDVNMGCTSPLVDRGGVMVCESMSHLVDGCSPDIDTSTSDWVSQLVTVRKSGSTSNIPFTHVLLTFGFNTSVSLTGIELDLFLCPERKIGAPHIIVYAYEELDFVFTFPPQSDVDFIIYKTNQSSCDSLSSIPFTLTPSTSYRTLHILVEQFRSAIDWVHVGEVRFLSTDADISPGLCSTNMVTPTTTTGSSPSTNTMNDSSSSPTAFIAIGAVIGVIAVAVLVLVTIIIIVVRKRRHFGEDAVKQLQDATREPGGVELKNMEKRDEYTADNPLYTQQLSPPSNGHQPAVTDSHMYDNDKRGLVDNPHYYSVADNTGGLPAQDSDLYTVVDEEKKATLKTARATRTTSEDTYASVSETKPKAPPSDMPNESGPTYASVDKGKPPAIKKKSPELYADLNEAQGDHIYSDVHKEASPAVPPKSPDLQVYLATQDAATQPAATQPPAPTTQPATENLSGQPVKVSSLPPLLTVGMSDNPNYESADAISHHSRQSTPNEMDSSLYAQPYFHTTQSTASADNDCIYSEPINPSDFTRKQQPGKVEEEEGDPLVYSPIYTVAKTDTFKQTVEITSENIIEIKELGTGQFGKVVLAQTNNLSLKDMRMSEDDNRSISIYVAVKKLRSNPTSTQREAFEKEIKFMSRLRHPNVVLFLGVCYQNPPFIIMEYMEKGDLSQFLQKYSEIITAPSTPTQISTSAVVNIAAQIASGMKYLASKNFIHRDLASRNCLVGDNFAVKLADFGMSRNLYESHYYKIQGNAVLPIRWMATECFYGTFSEKTDVWAFGITVWELFTLCKDKPYPDLNDAEVVEDAVNKGVHRQLHPKPPACPQAVYEVMLKCWAINPKERATFQVLHDMLHKLPHD